MGDGGAQLLPNSSLLVLQKNVIFMVLSRSCEQNCYTASQIFSLGTENAWL